MNAEHAPSPRPRAPTAAPVALAVFVAFAAFGACSDARQVTSRPHTSREPCAVRPDGAGILCGGHPFATLDCPAVMNEHCNALVLRYLDGEVVPLYTAPGDPKFDQVTRIATALDGSRIWFLETEGPFAHQRWRTYDVRTGTLASLSSREAERLQASIPYKSAIPLARNAQHAAGPR